METLAKSQTTLQQVVIIVLYPMVGPYQCKLLVFYNRWYLKSDKSYALGRRNIWISYSLKIDIHSKYIVHTNSQIMRNLLVIKNQSFCPSPKLFFIVQIVHAHHYFKSRVPKEDIKNVQIFIFLRISSNTWVEQLSNQSSMYWDVVLGHVDVYTNIFCYIVP